MDKIWDSNPSKSEVIGRCGGDENTKWPCRTDFCRLCGAIRFFHPRHNGQWPPTSKDCYPRFYPLHLFSYLNSWEIASIFPFECSVLNKSTTGTILITSLVWRGPWLGIVHDTCHFLVYAFISTSLPFSASCTVYEETSSTANQIIKTL